MASDIVLREKIFVRVDDPTLYEAAANRYFTIDIFEETNCERCPELDNRPSDVCRECQSYKSRRKLWSATVKGGEHYLGFPYGTKSTIKQVIPDLSQREGVLDKRALPPFSTKLRFTGGLREHQQAANDLLQALAEADSLRGVLVAPPRTGKTVIAIELACRLRTRTLILANTHPLCQQFYNTCVGSDNQEALTNAPALAEKGKVSVVLADKVEDFSKGDIVISTYQKFISELGKQRLDSIANLFGLLIVDEVHRANALSFLRVVSRMNTTYKLGLTATVTRKDGMHVFIKHVLGKVLHRIAIPTLVPTIRFHESGVSPPKDYSLWTYYLRWLERQEDRTQMILEWVQKDLKAGRSLVIPCIHRSQVSDLVRQINWEYGRTVAAAVVGGTTKKDRAKREEILDKARQGVLRVIVGLRSIVGTGVNVPLWDTLYWINPLANPGNWVQEYSRILTPIEGVAKTPIIRMFLDGSGQTRGCLRTCLYQTEGDAPTLASSASISPQEWAIAKRYLSKGKVNPS